MVEKRCWFCRRGAQELMDEFPDEFWDEQQDLFFEVELIGKVIGVDKVRPGDVPHSRHFRRKGAPEEEVHAFDDRRYAIVGRKCTTVSVCRACRSLETALTSLSEDGKGGAPYRAVYPPASEEAAIARIWERYRTEEKKMDIEFTDEAYRALLAIQRINDGGPITLWDLSQEMNVFNHRSLERPVSHLLEQCPGLGVLDRKTLTIYLNDDGGEGSKLEELVSRYEEFYRQREVAVATPAIPDRSGEIIARIKKLNLPANDQRKQSR
jgi:hypothetical protein